jgi:drug/metabolite transporter (DMT)-like permease
MNQTRPTRAAAVLLLVVRLKGYWLVVGAACCWATSGILVKTILLRYAPPPLALAFWRDALTFVVMVLMVALFRPAWLRLDRRTVWPLVGLGVISVGVFHLLWIYAVALIGVAPATVLNYTAPIFTVLFSWLVWREPITPWNIGAVLLTFAGCLLLAQIYDISRFQLNWAGFLAGLGTGITWATYPIFSKVALRHCSSWAIVTYAFGLSALTLLLPRPVQSLTFPWSQPADIWLWLWLLALVPTVAGFCLYSWGLRYLTASAAVVTATVEIVMASTLAYLILGESLQATQILGGVLILAGIVLLASRGASRVSAARSDVQ